MNGLQLNQIKPGAIQFMGRDEVDDVTSILVSIIRSLGVTLDRKLSFNQHVNNTCRSCYHHIRALRHISESPPEEVIKTVACSVIGSRLDYCNALLTGMSKSIFNKLQRVQNTLARVVLRQKKYEHITLAQAQKELQLATGVISRHIQNSNLGIFDKAHWSTCL